MDAAAIRDLLKRLEVLERTTVRARLGETSVADPLDITLGGADTIIEDAPRLASAGRLTAGDPIAALTYGNALLVLGRVDDAPAFLTDQDTTTRDGSLSGNVIYEEATITLTPGSWLVEAHASLLNLTTADGCGVGIYNRTAAAEVSSSRGPAALHDTTVRAAVASGRVLLTVTVNTDVCPYAVRNGASTLRVSSTAGCPAGKITAIRL